MLGLAEPKVKNERVKTPLKDDPINPIVAGPCPGAPDKCVRRSTNAAGCADWIAWDCLGKIGKRAGLGGRGRGAGATGIGDWATTSYTPPGKMSRAGSPTRPKMKVSPRPRSTGEGGRGNDFQKKSPRSNTFLVTT
jgi:hypothetical protein